MSDLREGNIQDGSHTFVQPSLEGTHAITSEVFPWSQTNPRTTRSGPPKGVNERLLFKYAPHIFVVKHFCSVWHMGAASSMSVVLSGFPRCIETEATLTGESWVQGFREISFSKDGAWRGKKTQQNSKAIRPLAILGRGKLGKWFSEAGTVDIIREIGAHLFALVITFSWSLSLLWIFWTLAGSFSFLLEWPSCLLKDTSTLLSPTVHRNSSFLFVVMITHPLYLCPDSYLILFDLNAVYLYPWHCILSFLGTRITSCT